MEETKYKIPFNTALADPAGVDDQVLAELVSQYPYVQSLRILQARRAAEAKTEVMDIGVPLRYIGVPHRLYTLLHKPDFETELLGMEEEGDILLVDDVETEGGGHSEPIGEWPAEAIDDATNLPVEEVQEVLQVFDIDDPEAEAADQILEAQEMDDDGVATALLGVDDNRDDPDTEPAVAIETVVPESHDDERLFVSEENVEVVRVGSDESHDDTAVDDSLDVLPEHPIGMDYLAYEEHVEREEEMSVANQEDAGEQASAESTRRSGGEPITGGDQTDDSNDGRQVVPASQARPHEKVSVYDDEQMPYTFLWWLNKARMEHAGTYQPYANSAQRNDGEKVGGGDQVLLDQQIRENIFHLQPPEDKLTAGNEGQTVSFKVPKETDPIIERFIREEPQIKPPNPEKLTLKNMAKQSAEDALEIVTETLATIYADQGHYNKAIDAYKKLSLKYPEKSSYFADRISDLEKKIF